MNDSYATPVLVVPNTDSVALQRIPFRGTTASTGFDEKWLEDIFFKHPKILPIFELDAAFSPLVPICRQLNVTGLSIDALFAANSKVWVSAYLAQSSGRCGVYLTFERGPIGDRLYAALWNDEEAINRNRLVSAH